MAGLDAPSTDLTARIQARRKQMVLAGELAPMKPGEHVIHGRAPAGSTGGVDIDAIARAAEARERRAFSGASRSQEVVEMDLTDYTGTQPGTKELEYAADADEVFLVGDEPDDEFDLGPDEPVADRPVRFPAMERSVSRPAKPDPRITDLVAQQAEILERLDQLATGFLALARGMAEGLAALAIAPPPEPAKPSYNDLAPEAERESREKGYRFAERLSRWQSFLYALGLRR